jgi:phosphate uptake regulator
MDYRKLISFGKSSYIISLPKAWVTQNKLKKGDLIYIEENGSNLVLSKKDSNEIEKKESKVINIDGKSPFWVGREVCSAYILNNHEIVLKGNEIRNKVKDFQSVVQGLIALEVMEQTSETMVAKDFLNMDQVSLIELVKKMDVVTRTMFKESASMFKEDNCENINNRDKDINRLYFLLYRAAVYNLQNPTKAIKNFKLNALDLLQLLFMGFYIEIIADEVRRTVKAVNLVKNSKGIETDVINYLAEMEEFYLESIKAFYKKDVEAALRLSERRKKKYDLELEKLNQKVTKTENYNKVVNHLGRLVTAIHNLGRVIYTIG